jgi:DNA-binding winged helix-turn-helix (wHTH) protein
MQGSLLQQNIAHLRRLLKGKADQEWQRTIRSLLLAFASTSRF